MHGHWAHGQSVRQHSRTQPRRLERPRIGRTGCNAGRSEVCTGWVAVPTCPVVRYETHRVNILSGPLGRVPSRPSRSYRSSRPSPSPPSPSPAPASCIHAGSRSSINAHPHAHTRRTHTHPGRSRSPASDPHTNPQTAAPSGELPCGLTSQLAPIVPPSNRRRCTLPLPILHTPDTPPSSL